MPGDERNTERDLLRKVRRLSRLFLKQLHSTHNEFLASSPVSSFPLPSPSESETSESDSEGKEVSCRKRKKKAGRKSKDQNLEQKEGNGSDKENETKLDQIDTIEKEPINGKHPKTKRSKTSEPQTKRRTLRSRIQTGQHLTCQDVPAGPTNISDSYHYIVLKEL